MRAYIFFLGLCVALGLGLVAAPGPAAGQLVEKKDKNEVKTQTVRGNLTSVKGSALVVEPAGKRPVTLQLNSGTKIMVNGQQAALTDLRRGQQVSCTYVARAGANVCLSVTVQAAKE